MNRHHPVDELFRNRLEHHSVEPPMQVWQRIEESRRRAGVAVGASRLSIFWIAACTAAVLAIPRSEWTPRPASVVQAVAVAPAAAPAVEIPAPREARMEPAGILGEVENQAAPAMTARLPARMVTSDALAPVAAVFAAAGAEALQEEAPLAENEADVLPATWSADPLPVRNSIRLLQRARSFPEASKCATFKNMGVRFHVELTASPDLALRRLTPANDTPEGMAYAEIRERSEQPLYNYSFNARIAASTRFGLSLRTGLQYAQINEQLRFVTETEQRFTIINIIGPGGNVVGVDTVYETIYREKTLRNRYRMLSVPLLAGYELPVKRWLFSAHGGALVNIMFRQQGSMFQPQGEMPVDFAVLEQEGVPAFDKHLGIGWYAGAGVAYKLRPKLQIMVEPHLRAFPRSFTTQQHPVRQHYTQGGVALGLRYQI